MTKKTKMEIHIGSLVQTEFEMQGRKVVWLAEQLNCNRSNVYSIFQRENMDVEMLIRLSRILHHNFLLDLAPLAERKEENDNKSNN